MKKLLIYFLSIFAIGFLFIEKALAVCPLCTMAVGAGVGFSRWLGIDGAITGLWIGGFIVSLISWTEDWLEKKSIRFKGRIVLNILVSYALIIIPLYYSGIIGNPLGIIAGSLAFWFGSSWYFYLKGKNKGRAYFPFQKVVMPVSPLIILSLIYYFLTR